MIGLQYARARGSGARAYIENLHTDRGYRSTSAEAPRRPLVSELPAAVSAISVQKNFYSEQVWLTHDYYKWTLRTGKLAQCKCFIGRRYGDRAVKALQPLQKGIGLGVKWHKSPEPLAVLGLTPAPLDRNGCGDGVHLRAHV